MFGDGLKPILRENSKIVGRSFRPAIVTVISSHRNMFKLPKRSDYFPGVLEWAFCGKSKVNTRGSVPVFSISTPPLDSAA